uniref:Ribosomal protein L2 n=1 Tax=Babesia duncani TaxID=323732 RepID=A0A385GNJ7_9APIC|nr:ribosomal protein L2 [Babesia duncani]
MIIFKINCKKKLGKSNKGIIITRHKEIGNKSLYIPIDLNYFNYNKKLSFILYDTKYNFYYRNTKLILLICLSGKLKGEHRYILKPLNKKYNDIINFYNKHSKKEGDINYLGYFSIGDKLYNIEFDPYKISKLCVAYKSYAVILNILQNKIILKLPSNKLIYINILCRGSYGCTDDIKNIYNKTTAGSSRLLGIRPTVRGTAMNACDHPHGGGEGKSPIGRKTRYTFKGKQYKGIKTTK